MRKIILSLLLLVTAQTFYMGAAEPKQLYDDVPTYLAKNSLNKKDKEEIRCLADNIYHEAASESFAGWIAVAFVTMNRVNNGNYPPTVCGVVYQKVRNVQQFSWVNSKKVYKKEDSLYNEIVKIATMLYFNHDKMRDITGGALFYHATYVKPNWKNLQRTTRIGQHIFYKTA